MVTAILASAHLLDADNMAAAASLLVGPCAAAGGRGLAEYPRGQAALRQGAVSWFQSQAPDSSNYLIGMAAAGLCAVCIVCDGMPAFADLLWCNSHYCVYLLHPQ